MRKSGWKTDIIATTVTSNTEMEKTIELDSSSFLKDHSEDVREIQ